MKYYSKLSDVPPDAENEYRIIQQIFDKYDPKILVEGDGYRYHPKPGSRAYVTCTDEELVSIVSKGNFHELIREGDPRRLFFDIDLPIKHCEILADDPDFMQWIWEYIEDESVPAEEVAYCLLYKFIEDIEALLKRFGVKGPIKPMIFHRNREDKFSFHIVITGCCVENYLQQAKFNRYLRTDPEFYQPECIYKLGIIDPMDKKTQHFAIPFSFNKGYQLLPLDEEYANIPVWECLVVCLFCEENPIENLDYIELTNDPQAIYRIRHGEDAKCDNVNTGDADAETADRLFRELCPDIAEACGSYRQRGNFLNYTRNRAAHCDICDREHTNDNTIYVLICRNGTIMRGCIRTRGQMRLVARGESTASESPAAPESKQEPVAAVEKAKKEKFTNAKRLEKVMEKISGRQFVREQQQKSVRLNCENEYKVGRVIDYCEPNMQDITNGCEKLIAIKAGMGVGKTKAVMKYLGTQAEDAKFGYISFRKTLTRNILQRFNTAGLKFQSYMDLVGDIDVPRWICQVESLPRIRAIPDILVIDEIVQVIKQLFSTKNDRIGLIFNRFRTLLKHSKQIVLMDADLDYETLDQIIKIAGINTAKQKVLSINNSFRKPYKMEVTTCQDTLRSKMLADVKAGKRVILATNFSHKKNLEYKEMFETGMTKAIRKLNLKTGEPLKPVKVPKVLLYTRETAQDAAVKETLDDVNKSWKEYDVIIYSPTIQSGVSFEEEHFDECYGVFNNLTNTYSDCSQMLHRVRSLTGGYHVCLMDYRMNSYPTELVDIENYIELQRESLFIPTAIQFEELVDEYDIYYKFNKSQLFYQLWIAHLRDIFTSRMQFMRLFIDHEHDAGAEISVMKILDEVNLQLAKTRRKKIEIKVDEAVAKEVADAKDIDFRELNDATINERKKWELRNFYSYQGEIDTGFVQLYSKARSQQLYKNWQDIDGGLENLRRKQRDELLIMADEKQSDLMEFETMFEFSYKKHSMIHEILQLLRIKDVYDCSRNPRELMEKHGIPKLMEYVEKHQKFMAVAFSKREPQLAKKWTFAHTLKYLNPIFDEMYGMKLVHNGTKKNAANEYWLEHNAYGVLFKQEESEENRNKVCLRHQESSDCKEMIEIMGEIKPEDIEDFTIE